MSNQIQYTDEPVSKLKVVTDFLPSPQELLVEEHRHEAFHDKSLGLWPVSAIADALKNCGLFRLFFVFYELLLNQPCPKCVGPEVRRFTVFTHAEAVPACFKHMGDLRDARVL